MNLIACASVLQPHGQEGKAHCRGSWKSLLSPTQPSMRGSLGRTYLKSRMLSVAERILHTENFCAKPTAQKISQIWLYHFACYMRNSHQKGVTNIIICIWREWDRWGKGAENSKYPREGQSSSWWSRRHDSIKIKTLNVGKCYTKNIPIIWENN